MGACGACEWGCHDALLHTRTARSVNRSIKPCLHSHAPLAVSCSRLTKYHIWPPPPALHSMAACLLMPLSSLPARALPEARSAEPPAAQDSCDSLRGRRLLRSREKTPVYHRVGFGSAVGLVRVALGHGSGAAVGRHHSGAPFILARPMQIKAAACSSIQREAHSPAALFGLDHR